ncbi:thiamine pyrophosphate-binding protein [Betaproteobacteria bacterium PRO7]|nr:thiamine pyrophosphate-binding protein [Betaproteobacteria bacterium PRO7]
MSAERNGADAICAALLDAGVDTVFGVPGTQTVALYEALRRSGIRTVTATHELAATFMAQGYLRASGQLAAVSAIPGPGFAFALAALPEAYLDSAAVVLLTGQPPVCPLGRRRAQSIDQATMAAPVVKAVIDIADADQAGGAIRSACAQALSGEPGPVLVQVAQSVYWQPAQAATSSQRSTVSDEPVDVGVLREAAAFCASAKRVLFYTGQGAADAADELNRVVGALGALVATTPSGRGVLREDFECVLPLDATGDAAAFNSIAAECDAIVVLGAALGENGTVGFGAEFPEQRLVRVDRSPSVLVTPPKARFTVRTSSREFLRAVLDVLANSGQRAADRGFDAPAARALRARLCDRRIDGPADARIGGGDPSTFFATLRHAIPDDGCLVLDSGMHQLLARRHFPVLSPRGLLFPADFQSMAFGLPAAIGAKLAQPNRAVAALIGDGGFAMTGLELRTAVQLGLSLPVIVFDDGALGLIRLDQLLSYGRAHATDLSPLDYAAMADAVGCAHASAGCDDIESVLATALRRSGPTLIVVQVCDAPALQRARRRHHISRAVKALLGARLVGVLRAMRKRR